MRTSEARKGVHNILAMKKRLAAREQAAEMQAEGLLRCRMRKEEIPYALPVSDPGVYMSIGKKAAWLDWISGSQYVSVGPTEWAIRERSLSCCPYS